MMPKWRDGRKKLWCPCSVIATLFGVCTSLGLGTMQINRGLHLLQVFGGENILLLAKWKFVGERGLKIKIFSLPFPSRQLPSLWSSGPSLQLQRAPFSQASDTEFDGSPRSASLPGCSSCWSSFCWTTRSTCSTSTCSQWASTCTTCSRSASTAMLLSNWVQATERRNRVEQKVFLFKTKQKYCSTFASQQED